MVENLAWYDIMRVFTVLFATTALYISTRRAWHNWNRYTRRLQELIWVVWMFLILLIESSIEPLYVGAAGGPRDVLSVIVSAVFLRAVTRHEGYIKDEKEN